ncbi:MAG: hypothetical protein M1396_00660 [Chloroflexi bacterium]|nr:hypothetical protein [Chloroflexota bacterium]MCL5947530.1 hypothetical protein [Chloroflexota bacterium]
MLVHGWVLLAMFVGVMLAFVALARGASRLLVADSRGGRLEGALLIAAGIAGCVEAILARSTFR